MPASMYPLSWPEGWVRTDSHRRKTARYKVELNKAVREIHDSLKLLGATGDIIISSNVPPTNSLGMPKNDGTRVSDPGVSVWWVTRHHGERVIACDRWITVKDNLRACGLALEALRSLERAGASQILERAFTAFGQLPAAPGAPPKRPWWEVFGFQHGMLSALSIAVIDARYRELAKKTHPDHISGKGNEAIELNRAYEEAKKHYANT